MEFSWEFLLNEEGNDHFIYIPNYKLIPFEIFLKKPN